MKKGELRIGFRTRLILNSPFSNLNCYSVEYTGVEPVTF